MARPILDDSLWTLIEPLLPPPKKRRRRYPGRKPLSHRGVLCGILFILRTGIPWEDLPRERGCGCGMTCWRRLRDWQNVGVWQRIHRVLLEKLHEADKIDWSRAVADSSSVRAVFGGRTPAPAPPIAAKKAQNTTSSLTPMARLWRRRSRPPIGMM